MFSCNPTPIILVLAVQVDMFSAIIRLIDMPTGTVTTLAGVAGINGYLDGIGSDVRFYFPTSVALDAAGGVAIIVSVETRSRLMKCV